MIVSIQSSRRMYLKWKKLDLWNKILGLVLCAIGAAAAGQIIVKRILTRAHVNSCEKNTNEESWKGLQNYCGKFHTLVYFTCEQVVFPHAFLTLTDERGLHECKGLSKKLLTIIWEVISHQILGFWPHTHLSMPIPSKFGQSALKLVAAERTSLLLL